MGHLKEKKRKSKRGAGLNKKYGRDLRSPLVVRELVGWMLRRGSEQMKELLKVISKYKWIHKLSSCCLQCKN